MLKKVLFICAICLGILSANATSIKKIDYKNLKEKSKLTYAEGVWSKKVNKKSDNYFVKQISSGTGSFSEFVTPEGEYLFSTGTQYEFLKDGRLFGYSNDYLKFYEYTFNETGLDKRELSADEVQNLFKKFTIIKLSNFSKHTNSLKLRCNHKKLKIILLNDTDSYFYHYMFSTGNAKLENYELRGFLNIKSKGMIQFSHFGENNDEYPYFILLVR